MPVNQSTGRLLVMDDTRVRCGVIGLMHPSTHVDHINDFIIVLTLFTPSPVTIVTSSCSVNKRERIHHALASIAWPMFQSGTSTMISIVFLAAVHAYMVQVFVKGVVLFVFLGMCHGLIVLPVVFAALPFKKARVSQEKPHQLTIMNKKTRVGRQASHA